jgi:hypothetical protein
MTIETCYNYFVFLNSECDRYLKDHYIDENEIHQLKIELDRFLIEASKSELPLELKSIIGELKLDYQFKGSREYLPLLGHFYFGRKRRERLLKRRVEEFNYQIKGLPMYLKMNY